MTPRPGLTRVLIAASVLVLLIETAASPAVLPSNLPQDVCDSAGASDLVVDVAFFVDTDTHCHQVFTQTDAPSICMLKFDEVEILAGAVLSASGSRVLALVATSTLTVHGAVDGSAFGASSGPGAVPGGVGGDGTSESAGGGGGGHQENGADGGHGSGGDGGGSGPSYGAVTLVPLRGGSRGGNNGADPGNVRFASGGGGGGGVQLVSCDQLTVGVDAVVHAGGGGGRGGPGTTSVSAPGGGGGGASGGAILLEADSVLVSGIVAANGGGGGGGGISGTDVVTMGPSGIPGGDGQASSTPAPGGLGGDTDAGTGGSGGALGGSPVTGGSSGTEGGGGGGGAAGRIRINSCTALEIEEGAIVSPAPSTGKSCSCPVAVNLDLSNQEISWFEVFEACERITAGDNFLVASGGEVIFRAGVSIVLEHGFSVESGGTLVLEIDPTLGDSL